MKFNAKLETIFVDSNSNMMNFNGDSKEKVNVILSPSLYWVQKVSLPVKYVRDVKKLLPSLFEDILPEGNYSYSAYKDADDFYIFAYEDKKIIDTLLSKGINTSSIANVYFAQSELSDMNGARKVSDSECIYTKEGLVVVVPCTWVEYSGSLDVREQELSKHSITLQQFGHIVDNRSLYKIGAIILILAILILSEYVITAQKVNEVTTLKEELFTKYKLKSTSFQNEAMFKKYDSIHKRQTKLREYLGVVLGLHLSANEKISFIALKNNRLSCEFSGLVKGKEKTIIRTLKSKGVDFTSSYKNNSWNLEMIL